MKIISLVTAHSPSSYQLAHMQRRFAVVRKPTKMPSSGAPLGSMWKVPFAAVLALFSSSKVAFYFHAGAVPAHVVQGTFTALQDVDSDHAAASTAGGDDEDILSTSSSAPLTAQSLLHFPRAIANRNPSQASQTRGKQLVQNLRKQAQLSKRFVSSLVFPRSGFFSAADDVPPYVDTMKIHLGSCTTEEHHATSPSTTQADVTIPPISIRLAMLNPFDTGYLEKVSDSPVSGARGTEPAEDRFLALDDSINLDHAKINSDPGQGNDNKSCRWSVDMSSTRSSASISVTDVNLLQPQEIQLQHHNKPEERQQMSSAWSSWFGAEEDQDDIASKNTAIPDTITFTLFDSRGAPQLICTATTHPPDGRSSYCYGATMKARMATYAASGLGIGFEFAVDLEQRKMTFTLSGVDWESMERYVEVAKSFMRGLGEKPKEAVLRFEFPGKVVEGGKYGSDAKGEWKTFTRDLHIQIKL
ncbi:unnamed protein product [Amoebophrya sp. A120]|nr:unnamed protein product [Amoebophrya sp. A120]|eukprot:GSA120T00017193001.1